MVKLKIECTKNNLDSNSIKIAYNLGLNECNLKSFWQRVQKNLPTKFITGSGSNHYWISYKSNNKRAAIILF